MIRFLAVIVLFWASPSLAKEVPGATEYPVQERRDFMDGCVNGDNIMYDFCQCVLGKFQETMTFKEFAEMNALSDEQLRKHKHFASAILTCAKAK